MVFKPREEVAAIRPSRVATIDLRNVAGLGSAVATRLAHHVASLNRGFKPTATFLRSLRDGFWATSGNTRTKTGTLAWPARGIPPLDKVARMQQAD